MTNLATFASGCFWCSEAIFAQLRGVHTVQSGYMGGSSQTANYRAVCSGSTGHAEVVQLEFDSSQISYHTLLKVFFATHDPTSLNRQGNDSGPQYRSEIFVHDEQQWQDATFALQTAQADFNAPIVTAISRASSFYLAEPYHHNYFAENPQQPYCAFLIAPKIAKFRQQYSQLLK